MKDTVLGLLESTYLNVDALLRARPSPPSPRRPLPPTAVGVVVQGPVVGRYDEPPHQRHTKAVLQSVRRVLPEAELVLSTWEGADLAGLDADTVVLSPDPGPRTSRETGRHALVNNVNRQVVSTRAGLEALNRPYALKLRSDLELVHAGFLRYAGGWPTRDDRVRVFRERVLVSTTFTANPRRAFDVYGEGDARRSGRVDRFPYHVSDWVQFGLLEDLVELWRTPTWDVQFEWLLGNRVVTSEQWVWMSLLNKHDQGASFERRDVLEHSALSITNNLVVLEPEDLGVRLLKFVPEPRHATALLTHGEWERMYERYCTDRRRVLPDPQGLLRALVNRVWVRNLGPRLRHDPVATQAPVRPVIPGQTSSRSSADRKGAAR